MPVSCLEWFSAEIAKFVDFLMIRSSNSSFKIFYKLKMRWQLSVFSRIQKSQRFAMLIAAMSVEEHKHAPVSKITSTKAIAIKAVNLRVSKDISDALEIHDH